MTLVQGTIVCVTTGTALVAIVGYLVDRFTARQETTKDEQGK